MCTTGMEALLNLVPVDAAKCQHPKVQTKRYVGTLETYHYCPGCMTTWGGEEGPRKVALIAAAAQYEAGMSPWESAVS